MTKRIVILTFLGVALCAAAENDEPRKPERTVSGNVLTSERDPGIRLEFRRPVEYLGADRWVLYDVADCEVHVFVEADEQKRVQRLYWVQFEGYIPGVTHSYGYDSPTRVTIGGLEFFADGGFRRSDAPYRRPGSDREHVVNLIVAKGYRLPAEVMSQRLVHLTDETRRKELMIIYAEDLAPTGYSVANLGEGGKAANKWPEIETALRERAVAGMKIDRRPPSKALRSPESSGAGVAAPSSVAAAKDPLR
jgi:hypothetical protein